MRVREAFHGNYVGLHALLRNGIWFATYGSLDHS
jgi:hypothetical protein